MKINLSTSIKKHLVIATIISLWLVIFLVLIAPFDTEDLSMPIRIRILPFYGVLSFTVYMFVVFIQNQFHRIYKTWNLMLEVSLLILFLVILTFCCFAYYKTDIINGTYDFQTFVLQVYSPISIILLPIIIFLRQFFGRKQLGTSTKAITLKGENKLDILKLLPDNIICISSADNYVEVNYLINGILHKKLLRNTLKGIKNDVPELVKVHRSHLINPKHFIEWNGPSSIKLTKVKVPVSKNYKNALKDLI